LRVDERTAVAGFDSVSICLSKGLGAPAGSILLGPRTLIADARRWRKALGGGMRQSGVLAAAGLYALENHVERLAEDHANAEYLAAGLRDAGLNATVPQTNVVYLEVAPAQVDGLRAHLKQRGVIASVAPRTRLMTHMDLQRPKIDAAVAAFREYPHWSLRP
jgi:threonine aldolase